MGLEFYSHKGSNSHRLNRMFDWRLFGRGLLGISRPEAGYKFNLPDILAVVGLAQLRATVSTKYASRVGRDTNSCPSSC